MKTTIGILFTLITCGCNACGSMTFPQYVNPELEPYVRTVLSWDNNVPLHEAIYRIDFGSIPEDLDTDTVAYCEYPIIFIPGTRQIVIDPIPWKSMEEVQKLALMAHELGHCQYNWKHSNNPADLMFEYPEVSNVKRKFLERLFPDKNKNFKERLAPDNL